MFDLHDEQSGLYVERDIEAAGLGNVNNTSSASVSAQLARFRQKKCSILYYVRLFCLRKPQTVEVMTAAQQVQKSFIFPRDRVPVAVDTAHKKQPTSLPARSHSFFFKCSWSGCTYRPDLN